MIDAKDLHNTALQENESPICIIQYRFQGDVSVEYDIPVNQYN